MAQVCMRVERCRTGKDTSLCSVGLWGPRIADMETSLAHGACCILSIRSDCL